MRYLTHETEDPFWQDQGAKPHPLAKSPHSTPDSQTPTSTPSTPHSKHSSPESKRVVKFTHNTSNGSLPASEEKIGMGSALYYLSSSSVGQTAEDGSSKGGVDSTDYSQPKSKYLNRHDEEIQKALAHAERIGYKVSTV